MLTDLKQRNMELSPMKRCNALLFLFLILLPRATSYLCYVASSSKIFNNGTLFPLDTDGLVGRYAGAWNNGTNFSDISFQLWFLSYDNSNYFLALVAIRSPRRTWDLLRPMVLWSASRETNNYVGENATLTFEENRGFQLRDADGRLAWSSTNVTSATRFCITNLADILLVNSSGELVWRASDFPSNILSGQVAFLPGNSLVSWVSRRNATKGPYSLEMKSNGLALKFKTETYWSFTFPLNGDVSSSSFQPFSVFCWQRNGLVTLDLQINYSSLVEPTENFLTAKSCAQRPPATQTQLLLTNTPDLSYASFVRLEDNGDLVYYTWNEETEYWIDGYKFSKSSKCFLPSQCGPYGICSKTTGECMESCPSSTGNFCNITVSSDPDVEFEFRTVAGMDYFSINYTVPHQVQSQEQCMQICESNSTCKAAFFKQTDCFLTHEDVQTLQTGEFVAFLKASKLEMLEKLETEAKKQRRLMDIGLGVLVPALVLLLVILAWTWKRHQKHVEEMSDKEDSDMELSLMEAMPRRFTYKELEQATARFSDCLGEGGYGSVYKGVLPEGTVVAVKKLLGANQRSQDFYAEIASLARTNHLNLVRFLGFCAQGPRKRLLVYEFMINGSLDKWIFEDENKGGLSWRFKYQIAAGTAQGLCYLHEECAERIIHLDLKPENVLLDSSFIPKIADFGLSKLMNREVTYLQMTSMRGTPGYLAPEYLQVGTITEKSDVFSFGVLLLEIITGCRNKSLSSDYLTGFATATASRADEEEVEVAARLRRVAYLCIQDDPDLRPSMSNVVKMMEGFVELPKPPSDSDVHFFLGYRSKLPSYSSSVSISVTKKTKLIDSLTSFGMTSLGPR